MKRYMLCTLLVLAPIALALFPSVATAQERGFRGTAVEAFVEHDGNWDAWGGTGTSTVLANFTGSATLTAVGDEFSASGYAKLSGGVSANQAGVVSSGGDVSVSCKGLTPGATYMIGLFDSGSAWAKFYIVKSPVGVANVSGKLTVKSGWGKLYGPPAFVEVDRVDADGNVCVLFGTISYKYSQPK